MTSRDRLEGKDRVVFTGEDGPGCGIDQQQEPANPWLTLFVDTQNSEVPEVTLGIPGLAGPTAPCRPYSVPPV